MHRRKRRIRDETTCSRTHRRKQPAASKHRPAVLPFPCTREPRPCSVLWAFLAPVEISKFEGKRDYSER